MKKIISYGKTSGARGGFRAAWLLAIPFALLMCLSSCGDDGIVNPGTGPDPDPDPDPVPGLIEVKLVADIEGETRASADFWNAGDEVGVFMIKNGQTLSDASVSGNGFNRDFRAAGSTGALNPLNANHKLYFPTDGSKVDFIAYHPYRSDSHVSNYRYRVDLSDQKADSLFLVYSNDAVGYDSTTTKTIPMAFSHKLAKAKFAITPSGGITAEDIAGMRVFVKGVHPKADFLLADGTFEYVGTADDFEIFGDETGETFEAVVIPTQGTPGDRSVVFEVPGVGDFTWDMPASVVFGDGKIQNMDVTVSMTGVFVEVSDIEEWKGKGDAAEEGEAKPKDPINYDVAHLKYPNSYIVAPGVELQIPVGKAFAVWATDPVLASLEESLSGTMGVKLVWQDQESLVTAANLSLTGTGKDAIITVKSDATKGEANAVVALTIDDEIFWSWFVWITNYDPSQVSGQKTNNSLTFMDRNLGALFLDGKKGRMSGTYYQWGRKDALPGANNTAANFSRVYDIDNNGTMQGVRLENAVAEPADNMKTSIRKPHHFIRASISNWYSTGTAENPYMWSKEDGTKGIYDPCPEGWRVPTSGAGALSPWNGLTLPSDADEDFYYDLGVDFGTAGFYCATGGYVYNTGYATGMQSTARLILCWSASKGSAAGLGYCLRSSTTELNASSEMNAATGMPVRCVKE